MVSGSVNCLVNQYIILLLTYRDRHPQANYESHCRDSLIEAAVQDKAMQTESAADSTPHAATSGE